MLSWKAGRTSYVIAGPELMSGETGSGSGGAGGNRGLFIGNGGVGGDGGDSLGNGGRGGNGGAGGQLGAGGNGGSGGFGGELGGPAATAAAEFLTVTAEPGGLVECCPASPGSRAPVNTPGGTPKPHRRSVSCSRDAADRRRKTGAHPHAEPA